MRDIIERNKSIDIERGIEIGLVNQRGVSSRPVGEGGKQEREIADEYEKQASKRSRTPLLKIAKELDISTKKVTERYKKLRGPVLVNSTITIDLKKLGYTAMAHIMIKVHNKSKTEEISANLLQTPNLIVLIARDRKRISSFQKGRSSCLSQFGTAVD